MIHSFSLSAPLAVLVLSTAACTTTPDEERESRWIVEERHPDGSPLVEGPEVRLRDGRWVAHGTWLQRYEDGSVEVEWARAYGANCGPWTAYYEDGTVHILTSSYGDREHGPFLEFHPDGSRALEETYVMGVPEGRAVRWDADGGVLWDVDWSAGEIVETRVPFPTAGSRGVPSAARIESIRAALRAEHARRNE